MKVVGLTGGIGSGKSTVAAYFKEIGVPVYIADTEAKKLMHTPLLKKKIIALLGKDSFFNQKLNTSYISSKVFENKQLLEQLNDIVHPSVAKHFKLWVKNQKGSYVIKEAAILFENGSYTNCDATILVIAPKKVRIKRVVQRDLSTTKQVLSKISNQWTDQKKIKMATFVIKNNSDLESLKQQVIELNTILTTL